MRKIKNLKKSILILFLILFSSLQLISLFSFSIVATYNIPYEHQKNGWHWEVDEGDMLFFEVEFEMRNATTKEYMNSFKDIWIYNITDIENSTMDYFGVDNFSKVIVDQLYYNTSIKGFMIFKSNISMAMFNYNNSHPLKERYYSELFVVPFVFPLNGSNDLQVDVMADILNKSYYYPNRNNQINGFDYYAANTLENSIYFHNTTENYFINASYFENNGTLKQAKINLLINPGDGHILIDVKIKRVFTYNITKNVQWGVDIGQEIYYDNYNSDSSSPYTDIKIITSKIEDITVLVPNNTYKFKAVPMVFQTILADVYIWNGTAYQLVESNFSLGYANKFYPIYFAPEQVGPPFVLPNNTNLEDISYIFNNDTHCKITSFTYDLVYMKENGCYNMEMRNSNDTSSKVSTFYDKATGILESILIIDGGEFSYLQLKNMTLVNWSVGIGDTIYYSTTIEGKAYEYKTSLLMSGGRLLNMTELEKESDGMIIAVEGQPELQFFKEYYGYLEYWNPEIQKWVRGSTLYPILGGNIYWALAPYMTQVMPPLYLTKGSTGEDLVNNGEGIKKYYDEITYKPYEVIFKNTTNGKCLKFIIDPQTGRILQGTGWMFSITGGNLIWIFNSFYHRNETIFSSDVNTVNFLDVLFPDVTLQYNLKFNSTENFLRTSLLKISPTIMELNELNPLFYCDFAVMHNESILNT